MSLRSGKDEKAPKAHQPSLLQSALESSRTKAERHTGQEKQAKLLASDTGHFSMIRFGLLCLHPRSSDQPVRH